MTVTGMLNVFKSEIGEIEIDQYVDKCLGPSLKTIFGGKVNQLSSHMMLAKHLHFHWKLPCVDWDQDFGNNILKQM